MDLTALLLKLYFNVESAYYEFLDAIDNYVPIYKTLVNPIEDNGYPSFPVYCILLAFIVTVLFFFSHAVQPTGPLYVQVQSTTGAPVSGAVISIGFPPYDPLSLFSNVASGTTDFSGRVGFVGIPVKPLYLAVSKDGYVPLLRLLDSFPSTAVNVVLEPTSETVLQAQVENEDRQRFVDDIERLKRNGHPEFAEAIQGEAPVLDG